MCDTCVFRKNGNQLARPKGRLDEIRQQQLGDHRHVCHTEGVDLKGDVVAYCRGAERYRVNKLNRKA